MKTYEITARYALGDVFVSNTHYGTFEDAIKKAEAFFDDFYVFVDVFEIENCCRKPVASAILGDRDWTMGV